MRNIFAPRLFPNLTFLERVIHAVVTFGIPFAIFDCLFEERSDDLLFRIALALFGGTVAAIFFAILEHLFFRATKKKPETKNDSP